MSLRREGTVHFSAGFWLLIAWFTWANGWRLLLTVLGAASVHELGHCLALEFQGARITGLRVGVCGAVLEAERARLSYGGELLAVLAGPGANLLCALLLCALHGAGWEIAAGANLVLCGFNMLPVRPLDGGRALELLVSWTAGPAAGEMAARWLGSATAVLLAAVLTWVMGRSGGSLWLLPPVVGLLAAAWRELCGI